MKRVLAIETSCDETAASVVEIHQSIEVLSSVIASQIDIHQITGGVVPEVAARAHVEAIVPVVSEAMKQADVSRERIDAVVATTRPGLRPALVVGETAGRALAVAWGKPFVPVHHIAGHIGASFIDDNVHNFPAVVLVVSGGHTQLFRMNEKLELTLLGQTRDDAAGEAFDKIARLLELPYPGGPELAKLAEKGNEKAFDFPRPMLSTDDLDFSFSGLKTAVYYETKRRGGRPRPPAREHEDVLPYDLQYKADISASAQVAIVDLLVQKTLRAVKQEGAQEVIIAGGVAANTKLRETMKVALRDTPLIVPPIKYCTDNAAMIGAAALLGIAMPDA